jgi:hypothetical protein
MTWTGVYAKYENVMKELKERVVSETRVQEYYRKGLAPQLSLGRAQDDICGACVRASAEAQNHHPFFLKANIQ